MFRDQRTDAVGSGAGCAPESVPPTPRCASTVAPGRGRPRRTNFLRDLQVRPDWQADALCAQTDPETFFPEQGASCAAAKKVCGQCPVAVECLAWAMDKNERFGVWGGRSERERDNMRRTGAAIVRPAATTTDLTGTGLGSPDPSVAGPAAPDDREEPAPAAPSTRRRRGSRGLSDRIATLYATGLSDGDIARECDCSTSNVSRWRRTRDLKPNQGAVA